MSDYSLKVQLPKGDESIFHTLKGEKNSPVG